MYNRKGTSVTSEIDEGDDIETGTLLGNPNSSRLSPNLSTLTLASLATFIMQPQKLLVNLIYLDVEDWTELVFAFFFIVSILSFILSFIGMMSFYGYFFVFLCGLAWQRVHLLGSLKKQLDRFDSENKKLGQSVKFFQDQNKELKASVQEIKESGKCYIIQNQKLQSSIAELSKVKDMIEQYSSQQRKGLSEVLDAFEDSLKKQEAIQSETSNLQAKTAQLARSQEKCLVMNIFFQVQHFLAELLLQLLFNQTVRR